jgi:hypothetical protein
MRFRPFHAALFGLGLLTGSAPLWPAAADIAVSRQDCDRLVKYQEPPGVEYQPGIDAHGETVVPADLGGGTTIKLPDTIIIPIEVLIQRRYHIPANSALWSSKAEMGVVTVQGDQVLYNGQPLTDPETAALADLCKQQLPYK